MNINPPYILVDIQYFNIHYFNIQYFTINLYLVIDVGESNRHFMQKVGK